MKACRKISMVMACYNSEPYIDKMFQSIIDQIWDGVIELIAVNGSSTDGTKDKLREWKPRFTERGFVLRSYELPGSNLVEALNEALKHITGDYVAFPDSDDYMYPEFCKELIQALDENPDFGWSICAGILTTEEGKTEDCLERDCSVTFTNDPLKRFCAGIDSTHSWCMMFRREYLEKCMPGLNIENGDSHQFPIKVSAAYYGNYAYVDKVLYQNIRHLNSGLYRAQVSAQSYYEQSLRNMEQTKNTLNRLPMDTGDKAAVFVAVALEWLVDVYRLAVLTGNGDIVNLLAEQYEKLAHMVLPGAEIPSFKILSRCYYTACHSLIRYALDIPMLQQAVEDYAALQSRQYIVYGASFNAFECLPVLFEAGKEPYEIWDIKAMPGNTVADIPLSIPKVRFDGLTHTGIRAFEYLKGKDIQIVPPRSEPSDMPVFVLVAGKPLKSEIVADLYNRGHKEVMNNDRVQKMIHYVFAKEFFPALLENKQ